ncbi:hypothetical protein [Pseudomonas sp. LB3P31]
MNGDQSFDPRDKAYAGTQQISCCGLFQGATEPELEQGPVGVSLLAMRCVSRLNVEGAIAIASRLAPTGSGFELLNLKRSFS